MSTKAVITMHDHPHPGEILKEDLLEPLGLTVTEAAKRLGMTRLDLSRVLNGKAGISPELALRLEHAGVSTARFWMNLQPTTSSPKRPRAPSHVSRRYKHLRPTNRLKKDNKASGRTPHRVRPTLGRQVPTLGNQNAFGPALTRESRGLKSA